MYQHAVHDAAAACYLYFREYILRYHAIPGRRIGGGDSSEEGAISATAAARGMALLNTTALLFNDVHCHIPLSAILLP